MRYFKQTSESETNNANGPKGWVLLRKHQSKEEHKFIKSSWPFSFKISTNFRFIPRRLNKSSVVTSCRHCHGIWYPWTTVNSFQYLPRSSSNLPHFQLEWHHSSLNNVSELVIRWQLWYNKTMQMILRDCAITAKPQSDACPILDFR